MMSPWTLLSGIYYALWNQSHTAYSEGQCTMRYMPRALIYTHSPFVLWSHKASCFIPHMQLPIAIGSVSMSCSVMWCPSATVEISAESQWQYYQCLMYHCCHPGSGNCYVIMRGSHGRVYIITDPLYRKFTAECLWRPLKEGYWWIHFVRLEQIFIPIQRYHFMIPVKLDRLHKDRYFSWNFLLWH